MEYQSNATAVLFNLFIWLLLILKYGKSIRRPEEKINLGFFSLLIIVFCVFAFSEQDTYSYHSLYDQMLATHRRIHVEGFYYWLATFLPNSYYLWRLVIWGGAFLLLMHCFKRYDIDEHVFCFVFPLLLLPYFATTRSSLGIALFLLSISYFQKPNFNRLGSLVFGLAGCTAALFLHKSLPLFIAIYFISLFIPLNKYSFWALAVAFPILRMLILPFAFDVLESTSIFAAETIRSSSSYLETAKLETNFNGKIRNYIDYIPRFLLFYILIKSYIFQNRTTVPKPILGLFKYSFFLFYIALLFWGQDTSVIITFRVIHVMVFPLTIVLSYFLSTKQNESRITIAMLLLFLISDLFKYTYAIYSW